MAVGDLVGKTINELTVLKEYRENNRTLCKVKCSCGKITVVRKDHVKSGSTKSCGHLAYVKPKDITNQRFGKLVALKPTGRDKYNNVIWLCKCDCGNEVNVSLNVLGHRTNSCGCMSKETSKRNLKKAWEIGSKSHVEGTNLITINRDLLSNNTSGYTGVIWDKHKNRWIARIEFKGKNHYPFEIKDSSRFIHLST